MNNDADIYIYIVCGIIGKYGLRECVMILEYLSLYSDGKAAILFNEIFRKTEMDIDNTVM